MRYFTKLMLFVLIIGIYHPIFAQKDAFNKSNEQGKHKIFANIFTGGYHNLGTKDPNVGFELSTALLGYKYTQNKKLKFTLIYDVTRTTHGFKVQDSIGNLMSVNYFEGSKYTAFLKMAEIEWTFAPGFSLSAGEILNEQYLTVQDKVWNHRYVAVTMQELYRMAYPADFGMRLKYRKEELFSVSLSAINGNGPFRHQDRTSLLDYTANIEFYKLKNVILKTFASFTPSTKEQKANNYALSFFGAYKTKDYTLGIEYSYTNKEEAINQTYSGASAFASYRFLPKWEVFARYDYVKDAPIVKDGALYLGGIQYQPEKNLFLSLNYRFWQPTDIQQIYLNFGAKF